MAPRKKFLAAGLLAAGAVSAAHGAEAASVEIKDAVARVTIVPEARSDIKVEIVRSNARLPLEVRALGDRTIIDGDLDRKIRNCRGTGEQYSVSVRGVGDVAWADMPQVVIRTPRDVQVEASGAITGTVGRSEQLNLANAGCGDWTIANVQAAAKVSQAGSGDTRMGSAGSLKVRIAGSGDVSSTDVRNGYDVSIAGSGSSTTKSVSGPLSVSIAGSGDVTIGGGQVSEMKVSVAGSGNVDFRGSADTLRARIAGSGDVHANAVKGEVSKSVMGSGEVRIGG
jgi:Putative auto-transporter adhesin, head GIN domain